MIRHCIIWKLKDELSEQEKRSVRENAKEHLEGLTAKIDGLLSLQVIIDPLEHSSGDMMLDSTFVSLEALRAYSAHPEHQSVANQFVRPFVATRACVDYEMV